MNQFPPTHATFKFGDKVRKKSGSCWQGKVVGIYSTHLTPEGYAIESDNETGSVQIYPAKALDLVEPEPWKGKIWVHPDKSFVSGHDGLNDRSISKLMSEGFRLITAIEVKEDEK